MYTFSMERTNFFKCDEQNKKRFTDYKQFITLLYYTDMLYTLPKKFNLGK